MKLEDRIKLGLKQLYRERFKSTGNQDTAVRGFIFLVIQTIGDVVEGKRDYEGEKRYIAEIVEEGVSKKADWMLLAECYQELLPRSCKKEKGQFYTPPYAAEYMVDKILEGHNIVENPAVKVLDPSCGGGVFLVKAFEKLVKKILYNLEDISKRHPHLDITPQNAGKFVAKHIYGIDTDPLGVELTRLQLYIKSGLECPSELNVYCGDFFTWKGEQAPVDGFDIVLGNPPYIGHKKVPIEYRRYIRSSFPDVLVDKGDISYCFIKKGVDLLKEGGILSFIVSRYFMEAPGGEGIRSFLMKEGYFYHVIDFYGNRVLEGIQVDPLIFFFNRRKDKGEVTTDVIKVTNRNIKGNRLFTNLRKEKKDSYSRFNIKWNQLDAKGWRMIPDEYSALVQKLESQCQYTLGSLVSNFQGIITGCDRAFIVNPAEAEQEGIEGELLKKWIKNSNIGRFLIKGADRLLIYTDSIDDVYRYTNTIAHLLPFKERLEKRRECRKGVRKWYQLQWGRSREKFERPKVVYPYKASSNRFAIDYSNCYFSADVYAFFLKDHYKSMLSLEYIAGILNSKLYNFYFKCFGKKLGADMYEYYPNTVMRLGIKVQHVSEIEEIVRLLISPACSCRGELYNLLNNRVYRLFGLTGKEIDIIEESLMNN